MNDDKNDAITRVLPLFLLGRLQWRPVAEIGSDPAPFDQLVRLQYAWARCTVTCNGTTRRYRVTGDWTLHLEHASRRDFEHEIESGGFVERSGHQAYMLSTLGQVALATAAHVIALLRDKPDDAELNAGGDRALSTLLDGASTGVTDYDAFVSDRYIGTVISDDASEPTASASLRTPELPPHLCLSERRVLELAKQWLVGIGRVSGQPLQAFVDAAERLFHSHPVGSSHERPLPPPDSEWGRAAMFIINAAREVTDAEVAVAIDRSVKHFRTKIWPPLQQVYEFRRGANGRGCRPPV